MSKTKTLVLAPVVFLSVFFVVPVANALLRFFRFSAFSDALSNQSLRGVAWFSLWQAIISTLVTLAIGLPATWALSRFTFPGSRLARGILTAPFVLPAVVVAAGVLAITDSRGVIPILWAHVVFNVSVVLRIVGPRWSMVNLRLENAAATLGARPSRTFTLVVWPQISDAVISAATLIFIYCFTSFGVIAILGGVSRRTLESEIFTQAVRLGNTTTATALAVLQAMIIGVVFFITRRSSRPNSTSLHVSAPQALRTKPSHRTTPLIITAAAIVIVASPLLATIYRSLVVNSQLSLSAWRSIFSGSLPALSVSPQSVISTSLMFAITAACICVPLALLVVTTSAPRALFSLPLAISAATLGIGLIITFNTSPYAWRSERWFIPVIHAVIALPLVIRALEPAASAIPHSLRNASATLGASPFATWRRVELPLLKPALLRATGLSMAISLGEFGATSFLSRSGSTTLPIAIAQLLGRPGVATQQAGFALAALMVLVTVGVMSRA
ncbi:MAG: iron ABC transporter permease [Ilumatobacteraceae bacterium]|nr:iron ABC transporter permease [Ilumatobacteraceae bacterium]